MDSPTKPRIVHIISGLATGGAQRSLANLLEAGLCDRFDNQVVSLTKAGTMGGYIERLGVPVRYLDMRARYATPKSVCQLRRVIDDQEPQMVQGWMYHGNLAASAAVACKRRRPVLTWNIRHSLSELAHEKFMTRWAIRVGRFVSNQPDAIVYNSCTSRSQHETFGYASRISHVIPNGFDLSRFDPDYERNPALREEIGIPNGAAVVGHISRLHPMKDHGLFLKAAALLARRQPEVHFLMVGTGVTRVETTLAPLVRQIPAERIHMLDERHDVEAILRTMDVLCSTSAWGEGFPNILGESMASGVPCIATDVGDNARIIGSTGEIVPPGDVGELAEAVERMLAMKEEQRVALGQAARRRIESEYSIGWTVARYTDLYKQLLGI